MYLLLSLYIMSLVSISFAEEENTACPHLTEEQLARLKKLQVAEDVHSKLVGDFSEMWGPKLIFEEDPETCIHQQIMMESDTVLKHSVTLKGKWFGGVKTHGGTLIKLENGVYLVKNENGTPKAKVYFIYVTDNVASHIACMLGAPPADKKHYMKLLSVISVRKEALTSPLDEGVHASIDEAKKKFQDDEDLFGQLAQYQTTC